MTAPWLKKVLADLEVALMLLVDAQIGRAPCGGETLGEARILALLAADERIERARSDFARQAATLTRKARKRAAALFAATFALRERVKDMRDHEHDTLLFGVVTRCESIQN